MRTKQKRILIGVVIALLLVTLFVVMFFLNRVAMNPEGTVGNTAGNLNNSGLFCEHNETVYFANSYDGSSLYAMSPDETDIRRLSSVEVQNILAGGKYVYYFQTGSTSTSGFGQVQGRRSLNRCNLKGKDTLTLTTDVVVSAQLVDNYLYILTSTSAGPSFYKMKIDKTDKKVLGAFAINPACARDGVIYYNGTEGDHYLYALNTANDAPTEVWAGNIWYPVLSDDYVYYMDVAENYRLCRYSLSQDIVEVLTNDRVDCFNVGSGYIYYQKNDSMPQLICMRTDGSNAFVVAEGTYTDINMTSQYVYFKAFDDKYTTYHAFLGGSNYSEFIAAMEAIPEK
ncbi:MAG: DUF5050 domain-containing protein [Eubacterium sp.]|nr:DUF5050 domain-containing protein [Eubacterium sp.]MCM1214675.1 DUF5050 domain-containing protein [Lachnospiraceae bacterium]MCM1304970.1 DUF5050 domain-containing protein [Butyrivibrio sp.]MCM1344503.1 DUF5050 domain-containing protein [Muribaculaceae bacterium]MCM1239496.1 DUF5050 domain-containing protein [Lachnospiraceae bacterium]